MPELSCKITENTIFVSLDILIRKKCEEKYIAVEQIDFTKFKAI